MTKRGVQKAIVGGGERITSLDIVRNKLSVHAMGRMQEREVTLKMVRTCINKGTRFYDPSNESINYILRNGFASGKDLLVGIDLLSGNVKTTLRGSDLLKTRMIPLQ